MIDRDKIGGSTLIVQAEARRGDARTDIAHQIFRCRPAVRTARHRRACAGGGAVVPRKIALPDRKLVRCRPIATRHADGLDFTCASVAPVLTLRHRSARLGQQTLQRGGRGTQHLDTSLHWTEEVCGYIRDCTCSA